MSCRRKPVQPGLGRQAKGVSAFMEKRAPKLRRRRRPGESRPHPRARRPRRSSATRRRSRAVPRPGPNEVLCKRPGRLDQPPGPVGPQGDARLQGGPSRASSAATGPARWWSCGSEVDAFQVPVKKSCSSRATARVSRPSTTPGLDHFAPGLRDPGRARRRLRLPSTWWLDPARHLTPAARRTGPAHQAAACTAGLPDGVGDARSRAPSWCPDETVLVVAGSPRASGSAAIQIAREHGRARDGTTAGSDAKRRAVAAIWVRTR